jgi:hypothetical protein
MSLPHIYVQQHERGDIRVEWLSQWLPEFQPKAVQTRYASAVLLFYARVERLLKYLSPRTYP